MLSYDEVLKNVLFKASRPDGYNGKRVVVGIALIRDAVIEVSEQGYYRCPAVSYATDAEEVLWLFQNHPNFREYKLKED